MSSMVEGLQEWGVPENQVQFEAFGPSTVRKVRKRDEANKEHLDQTATIEFCKSKITATWNSDYESILEAAEENDVPIESGCRAGNCGTCELKLKKGKVDYAKQIGNPPEEGKILSCVARPTGDIEIDA